MNPTEVCAVCGRRAPLATEIAFYRMDKYSIPLCQPFTGRDCLETKHAAYRAWREKQG